MQDRLLNCNTQQIHEYLNTILWDPQRCLTQLSDIHSDTLTFNHYAELTRDNHQKSIDLTWKDIFKNSSPVTTSYVVGGIAAFAYRGVAQKAAKGNVINYYLNPIGAVLINVLVNGYFFNLVVFTNWEAFLKFFNRQPSLAKYAMEDLKNVTPGFWPALGRGLLHLSLFLITIGPAFISAYPFYVLDTKEGNDSILMGLAVLLSGTMLQYIGVEALLYKCIPPILYPFRSIYHRFNEEARQAYKIKTLIAKLKAAYQETLVGSHQEILRLIQCNEPTFLQDNIYDLLMEKNPTKTSSMELLIRLCGLAKSDSYQPSSTGRAIFQTISVVLAIVSLPGLFLMTKEAATEYAQNYTDMHSQVKQWLLGFGIFLVSIALSLDVAGIVGRDLYDLLAKAANGIKTSWSKSTSVFDFVRTAWYNKANLGSWHNLISLPLSVIQNPKLMVGATGILYLLCLKSTQSTTYLNEEQLGSQVSQYILLPTIISVILFNAFPVDKILGSVQQCLTRLWGNDEKKQEIKLEDFLQKQTQLIDTIDNTKFVDIFFQIISKLPIEEGENFCKIMFGNKTPQTILGDDNPCTSNSFKDLFDHLKDRNSRPLSSLPTFFADREKLPLHNPGHRQMNGYQHTLRT